VERQRIPVNTKQICEKSGANAQVYNATLNSLANILNIQIQFNVKDLALKFAPELAAPAENIIKQYVASHSLHLIAHSIIR
jgi:hypothetical protein